MIFVAEIVGGALAFVFKDKAVDVVSNVLEDVYILRYQDDEDAVIDHFQENVRSRMTFPQFSTPLKYT